MCCVAVTDAGEAALAAKFTVMRGILNERQWRVYLGSEANMLGYGGIAAVARASGTAESTVAAGAAEAASPGLLARLPAGRSRRPGGGRPRAEDTEPGLTRALDGILEEGRRGDPMSEITWSILSLRDIARQLALLGFTVSKDTAGRLMREAGWSLQGMSRVAEGRRHPDRDAQFWHISGKIAEYRAAGQPVISTDGKKKEQLGAYHRDGTSWQPGGDPVRVRSHDFPEKDTVTITPYGVYDIAANRGFVSVGTSHDTAAFAVNAIRLWWQEEGQFRYPAAARLLVTCDAGGSNGHRSRLWKDQLAVLAAETGLLIEVCHFPPGTSKWNKIEHRLFCHITRTWRARPLMTLDDAVAGIAATITSKGLKCHPVRDDRDYPTGIEVPPARIRDLEKRWTERSGFHGEWNYAVLPSPRPGGPEPEPEPAGPDTALVTALAALAGIPDLDALRGQVRLEWEAGRTRQATLTRGHGLQRAPNAARTYRKLSDDTLLAAAACHLRLRMPWMLLGKLFGAHPSSISKPASGVLPVLQRHGTAPAPGIPRINTVSRLLAHAAAEGITFPALNPAQHPGKQKTGVSPSPATRPKQPTK
jgi:hypothetical protein